MSTLVLLGGPTGVGKTTVMRLLAGRFESAALLDADDVWRVSSELAIEGTRQIAIGNVVSVMKGYFDAQCEIGILSWVFARPQLFEPVIAGLEGVVDSVFQIYLICSPGELEKRLITRGEPERTEYAMSRLSLIRELPYPNIDTTDLTPARVADEVCHQVEKFVSE